MKQAAAILSVLLALSFWATPSTATGQNNFFQWVTAVVNDAYINKSGDKIAILVNQKWQKEFTEHSYVVRLPEFIACTRFAEEIWRADKEEVVVFVVLFNDKSSGPHKYDEPQHLYSTTAIPRGTCPFVPRAIR